MVVVVFLPYVSQPVRIPLSRAIIHLSPDIQMQLSYRLPQHDAIMANPVVSSACSFSRFRIAWRVKRPFKPSVSDILSLWIIVWKKNEILIPRFVGVEISFHKSFPPPPPRGKVIIHNSIRGRVFKLNSNGIELMIDRSLEEKEK